MGAGYPDGGQLAPCPPGRVPPFYHYILQAEHSAGPAVGPAEGTGGPSGSLSSPPGGPGPGARVRGLRPVRCPSAEPPSMRLKARPGGPGLSVLTCSAFSFYPPELQLRFLRNGLAVGAGDSNFGPNGDGSFHAWSTLTVRSGDEHHYQCVVQHAGLPQPLVVGLGEVPPRLIAPHPRLPVLLESPRLVPHLWPRALPSRAPPPPAAAAAAGLLESGLLVHHDGQASRSLTTFCPAAASPHQDPPFPALSDLLLWAPPLPPQVLTPALRLQGPRPCAETPLAMDGSYLGASCPDLALASPLPTPTPSPCPAPMGRGSTGH